MSNDFSSLTTQKIYLMPHRVIGISILFTIMGSAITIFGTQILYRIASVNIYVSIAALACSLAGLFLVYHSILLFIRRNRTVQLELNEKTISYRPAEWYSYGRRGSLNDLSVYFSKKWLHLSWIEIKDVVHQESFWEGNMIILHTIHGKEIRLFLIVDNKDEMRQVYNKIKSQLSDFNKSY